ncbi:MAG: F0F1 ATP synthase subunit B [Bacteroidaceae bacterium]|nr:F0F1 ATP synthase subunit B [Bacteroidaceae bacterium]
MSLFMPDSGLLFWMLLSFGVVLFVLAKFGFPVITRMVDDRKRYIDQSLDAAREANEKLANIKQESERILMEARNEQMNILKEAAATRDQIVKEAREKAHAESQRIMEEARLQILKEKENTLREIRFQTAELSMLVAEKIMRHKLEDEHQQMELVERLVEEAQNGMAKEKKD